MSADKQELLEFKAKLSRTPTNVIIKRLNENVIARAWKRALAEKEVARRRGEESLLSTNEALRIILHHKSAVLKSWIVTTVVIACLVAAAVTIGLNIASD